MKKWLIVILKIILIFIICTSICSFLSYLIFNNVELGCILGRIAAFFISLQKIDIDDF